METDIPIREPLSENPSPSKGLIELTSDEVLKKQGYLHPNIVRAQRERREREKNTLPKIPNVSETIFKNHKYDWVECDHCWTIADHPQKICNGCAQNQQVIDRLKARVLSLEGHMAKYRKKSKRRTAVQQDKDGFTTATWKKK